MFQAFVARVLRKHLCARLLISAVFGVNLFGVRIPDVLAADVAVSAAMVKSDAPITLPVRIVHGHMLALAYVFSLDGHRESISLKISLEDPGVLIANGGLYGFITIDEAKVDKGESLFVDFVFKPDIEIKIPAREITLEESKEREETYNHVTKFYSKYLDEHKVAGALGRGFFSKYRTVFDIGAGVIRLNPLTNAKDSPIEGDIVRSFEIKNGRMWTSVNYGAGRSGPFMWGTNNYDTSVDTSIAKSLGKPAGDVGVLWINEANATPRIDLSQYMAFRPRTIGADEDAPEHGAAFVSGINLMESFRLDFDWANSRIGITRAKDPDYPRADFDFFKAEVTGNADDMQAHLERFPNSRRAAEAAADLVKWRTAQPGATDEQIMKALQWVVATSPEDRKMEDCTPYVRQLNDTGRYAAAVRAGELALSHSRFAFNTQDTYRLHNIIGEAYLKQDQVDNAWEHFLSAAFIPLGESQDENFAHNVAVLINLGTVYEKQGRAIRAYSRFKKAEEKLRDRGALKRFDGLSQDVKDRLKGDSKAAYDQIQNIRSALERLRKEIPAADLKMLDG